MSHRAIIHTRGSTNADLPPNPQQQRVSSSSSRLEIQRRSDGVGKQWDLLSQELRPRSSSATGTASPLKRAPGVGEERSCSTFSPLRRCATEDNRQSLDISSSPKFCSSDNRDKCLFLVVRDWKDFCDEQTRRQG